MSKVEQFRRIRPEDLAEAPEWFRSVGSVINKQFESHSRALSSGLGFVDNMNAEVRELDLQHDTAFDITLQTIKGVPQTVIVAWTEQNDFTRLKWEVLEESKIRVTVKWDTTPSPSTKNILTRLVIFGP